MKIESVEVIPMRKESIFEDMPNNFEVCGITTDYAKWYTDTVSNREEMENILSSVFTNECRDFAKKQQAFMTVPVAKFGNIVYTSITRASDTLEGVVLPGPLYGVFAVQADDESKEKTVERNYHDPVTFELMNDLWYPTKTVYKIRYGVKTK